MAKPEVVEDALAHSPLESYKLFVKTTSGAHVGGFVFFSREEFNSAKDVLKKEVSHLMQSEQSKDPKVKFESWGLLSSATGEIAEEFTDHPGD